MEKLKLPKESNKNKNTVSEIFKNGTQEKPVQLCLPYTTQNTTVSETKKSLKNQKTFSFVGKFLNSPKFEKLHNINKKFCDFMNSKNEPQWQKYRKKNNKVSNILDGSYCPKIHNRVWYPNGQYKVKLRYNFTEIGLKHVYERKNVEQKKTICFLPPSKNDKEYLKDFSEYDKIKKGEYIVTIEYCSSCQEHSIMTQHSNDSIFRDLALNYQIIIKERFPFIKVILKPIDIEIVKNKNYKVPKVEKNGGEYLNTHPIDDQFKQCRIGAFEIQIASNKNDVKDIKLIHSRLKTKKFPKVNDVLDKIVSYMDFFKLNLVLFDKEDYEDLEKMNNIEVNIYLYNSNIIREVKNKIENQMMNYTSPGRRFDMLRMKKIIEKQNSYKDIDSLISKKYKKILSSTPTKVIEQRSKSKLSTRPQDSKLKNLKLKRNFSNNNILIYENLPENENDKFQNEYINKNKDLFFTEEELLKSQRGTLIKKKYSKIEMIDNDIENDDRSISVLLKFDPIPYDTYIIEIVENYNFESSWHLLRIDKINDINDGQLNKYIGLWHQKKATLHIHLFVEKKNYINSDSKKNIFEELEMKKEKEKEKKDEVNEKMEEKDKKFKKKIKKMKIKE